MKQRIFSEPMPPEVLAAQAARWQDLEGSEIMGFLRRVHPTTAMDLGAVALLLLVLPASVREQVEYLRVQAEAREEICLCPPSWTCSSS
ncbi:MAG: hypothetical protein JNJ46_23395 [Myxococcales bacterium]|nr:hypothetical protein [Myxococcales bacterium]